MPNPNPKYLLFLGCAIPYRVASYEISARKVAKQVSLDLVEMPDYNCCGLPLDPAGHDMMLTLAARNLCIAERQGLSIMTLCPGCVGTLRKVNKLLKEDKHERDRVNGIIKDVGLEFKGTIEVKHLMQVLAEDVGYEKIKETIKRPLTNLSVAEHGGCHLVRPQKYIGLEDPENPKIMKNLIEVTGATCLDYLDETECCGAPVVGVNDKISLALARDKLSHMKAVNAQALITVCPFCHMMFDTNQTRIERTFNETYGLPVLHYPQLLGLAMGFTPEELALKELRVDSSKLVSKI
jgi:heterodisulfide reductase subunit B